MKQSLISLALVFTILCLLAENCVTLSAEDSLSKSEHETNVLRLLVKEACSADEVTPDGLALFFETNADSVSHGFQKGDGLAYGDIRRRHAMPIVNACILMCEKTNMPLSVSNCTRLAVCAAEVFRGIELPLDKVIFLSASQKIMLTSNLQFSAVEPLAGIWKKTFEDMRQKCLDDLHKLQVEINSHPETTLVKTNADGALSKYIEEVGSIISKENLQEADALWGKWVKEDQEIMGERGARFECDLTIWREATRNLAIQPVWCKNPAVTK